ncbi:MAG: hypothetical protein Q9223_006870 [Gallowayella weberi]
MLWLYFGILKEILGDLFLANQFISKGADGKLRINTLGLETILGTWTTKYVAENDNANVQDDLFKMYNLLLEHRDICMQLHLDDIDLGSPLLMLSFAVISERLAAALVDMYAHFKLEKPVNPRWRLQSLQKEGFVDVDQPIIDLMQARGWCPYDLRRVWVQTHEVSLLYYYSSLDPPRSSKNHSACSDKRCLAMTTYHSTYKLSHHIEGCSCPLLYADQEAMAEILRRGSVPVIAIVLDPGSNIPKITVQDITRAQGFVAISHVWAEGAGNVRDNALQSCLLTNISELVKMLP